MATSPRPSISGGNGFSSVYQGGLPSSMKTHRQAAQEPQYLSEILPPSDSAASSVVSDALYLFSPGRVLLDLSISLAERISDRRLTLLQARRTLRKVSSSSRASCRTSSEIWQRIIIARSLIGITLR